MNCSRCGAELPAEAGFCRNCGAILHGKSASATAVVSGPQTDASPAPASPAFPATARSALPAKARSALPATASSAAAPGRSRGDNDRRMRRHMSGFDYVIIAGSVVVLLSTPITWYQKRLVVHGVVQTITRRLLSGNAGIQRPLVLVVAALIVVEVIANLRSVHRYQEAWRRHRGAVMVLCIVQFVLVVSCILSSPLGANSLSNIGISVNTGPGGWVALTGSIIGVLAAFGRMFAGNSALGRSTSKPSGARGRAGA